MGTTATQVTLVRPFLTSACSGLMDRILLEITHKQQTKHQSTNVCTTPVAFNLLCTATRYSNPLQANDYHIKLA